MAKKFVRGITDVKTINNQDFDTNNVNDLLSDGQYNYIHRKKGKTEEYHNLTDNIKTISSDNTDLLTVTNNNKTTNTATLHPKHDSQKEQLLESTRNTVTIHHGTNGTDEKTTVDTNPEKVLEHENLIVDYGLSKLTTGDTTLLGIQHTEVQNNYDLNNLVNGNVMSSSFTNAPTNNESYYVQSFGDKTGNNIIQTAFTRVNSLSESAHVYRRYKINSVWGVWRKLLRNKEELDNLLSGKQDTLTAGDGITIQGQTIDTNPQKVLEHENLVNEYGISKSTSGNTTKLGVLYTPVPNNFDLNTLYDGRVRANSFVNAPSEGRWFFVSSFSEGEYTIQEAVTLIDDKNTTYRRLKNNGVWGSWREQVGDKSTIDAALALKHNYLSSNTSIGVLPNDTLYQLYTLNQTYTHTNGTLKTHVKSVSSNTSVTTPEEEFNFILKINQGQQSATFTLNEHDKTKFNNIITTYGVDSSVRINGCLFTLSDATLTVSTEASTVSNHVITFSDII